MYSQCGSVEGPIRVFDEMPERNVLTWTALVIGLAVHGRIQAALRVFNEMRESGWQVFDRIEKEYGMEPTVEHYGCMVDLLGCAGLIKEAFEFVEKMPIRPNAVIWRTLLGACVNHKKLNSTEKVKENGDCVLLSNAYIQWSW
ncbi:hypothetical protein LWI29_033835 [Acer saccharum]|uniref:Pentatricopeptide repeat-containing protein n=1 Tax=Acer saccharum TaxID=4024 RepID=A0AA39S904_ACESA|nr:hypothetical protein LWI29_033835 [Acer saccharum]